MSTEVTDGEVPGVKSTVPTSGGTPQVTGGEVPGVKSTVPTSGGTPQVTASSSSQAQRDSYRCVCVRVRACVRVCCPLNFQ